jgi:hypothetical protein
MVRNGVANAETCPMPIAMLLMFQVTGPIGPSVAARDATPGSLLEPVPSKHCAATANEIVVCAKDTDSYRLPGSVPQSEPSGLPKAEWKLLGKATGGVGFSQRSVGGSPSNAVMATIKIPF